MKNWLKLSNADYEKVWNKIYDELKFEPSTTDFPSFKVPSPFIIYDVSLIWRI
ncbi:DUF2716 domain-containing protein [Psychrobacillus psychrotolerans]|uniref:DUF2716 domain-containing protein n=1 Tax=Psychrobacillus psychrotolerans TaxID=126156 RepID=UPI0033153371